MAAALGVLSLVVYLANGHTLGTGDTLPTRHLPVSLLREGNLDLDEFTELRADGMPYFLTEREGRVVSVYPVTTAVLATPVYLPLAWADDDTVRRWAPAFEKVAAALLTALSVGIMWLALSGLTSRPIALMLTVTYAFGTSTFSATSQALWQHVGGQLAMSLTLWALVNARADATKWSAPLWAVLVGAAAGLASASRPTNVVVACGALLSLTAGTTWRSAGLAVLGLLPSLVWHLLYNHWAFGDPWHLQWALTDDEPWRGSWPGGLAGLLVSPSRGLFVYSPVLLLAVPGAWLARRTPRATLLAPLAAGVVVTVAVYAKWGMWWGGVSYGPRILADLTPTLVVLMVPAVERIWPVDWPRRLCAMAVAWSIALHAIGAFCGNLGWNIRRDIDRHPERLWDWRDNQPVECVMWQAARLMREDPHTSRVSSVAGTCGSVPSSVEAGVRAGRQEDRHEDPLEVGTRSHDGERMMQ